MQANRNADYKYSANDTIDSPTPWTHVEKIMRSKVKLSVPQRVRDSKNSCEIAQYQSDRKVNDIARYCVGLLQENKLNLVSQALKTLTEVERDQLFNAWKESKDSLFQLLHIYYLSLQEWSVGNEAALKMLEMQLLHPSAGIPTNLLRALEVKYLFYKGKFDEAIKLLKDADKRVHHLNLEGLELIQVNSDLRGTCLDGVNLRSSILHFVGLEYSSIIKGDLENSRLYVVNLNVASLLETSFRKCHLKNVTFRFAEFNKTDFSLASNCDDFFKYSVKFRDNKLEGCIFDGASVHLTRLLPESFIRHYFDGKKVKPAFQPIVDYFTNWNKNHFVLKLFDKVPPLSKFLLAIELVGLSLDDDPATAIKNARAKLGDGNKYFKDALDKVLDNLKPKPLALAR